MVGCAREVSYDMDGSPGVGNSMRLFMNRPLKPWMMAAGRKRNFRARTISNGRLALRCAKLVAVINLAFVTGLLIVLRGLGASVPLPFHLVAGLSLPLISLAATVTLPAFAFIAWRKSRWRLSERIGFSVFVLLAVAFTAFIYRFPVPISRVETSLSRKRNARQKD